MQIQKLNFSYWDCENSISRKAIKECYEQIYLSYVVCIKTYIRKFPEIHFSTISKIQEHINSQESINKDLLTHFLNGYKNLSLFFSCLNPSTKQNYSQLIMLQIKKQYKDYQTFINHLIKLASLHEGSGFLWVTLDCNRQLQCFCLPNNETPLIEEHKPILCINLWEHIYTQKFINDKEDYVKHILNNISWKSVEKQYYKAFF